MKIQIITMPPDSLITEIDNQLEAFNQEHFDVNDKIPIAVIVQSETGQLQAGISAKTFGNWLLIENIWLSPPLRGKGIDSELLAELETAAVRRGCKFALLETLHPQTRPFYEKHGYAVRWTQEDYPTEGSKCYMVKKLG